MKRVILFALPFLMLASAAHATTTSCGEGCATNEVESTPKYQYLSPKDYTQLAFNACSGVEGIFLTNQSQECNSALSACKSEYVQYLKGNCGKTVDYYGDTYLNCTASTLDQAKQNAKSHSLVITSACSLLENDNSWPTACGNGVKDAGEACDDGNQADGDTCSKDCKSAMISGFITNFPFQVAPVPLPATPVNETNPPASEVQDNGQTQDPGTVEKNAPALDTPETGSAAFSGGACSLQVTEPSGNSLWGLMVYAAVGLHSARLFLRRKK